MKITYYNSVEYRNITTEEAEVILGNLDPDEMTDADREMLREDSMTPTCNFAVNGAWKSIPWKFVIEIDD